MGLQFVLFNKKIFLIYGLSGVGKTTILEDLIEDNEVFYINFGDIIYNLVKADGKVKNRDELMSKLKEEEYKYYYTKTIEQIEELIFVCDGNKVVIDTHLILACNFGYFLGIQKFFVHKIPPDYLIFIKAKPEEILERRKKDRSRNRRLDNIEEIRREIEIAEILSLAICFETGAIFKEINNHNGKLEEAKKEIKRIIKG